MKTITIKRRRRMTKHRKGMTKPRKSNRRIKNRKHKTRRQSGGWGWESFIKAQHNPLKIVFENDLFLLLRMVTGKNKGIDVKYKTESSGNRVWLIGNTDKTFKELRDGAKDGRYQTFIEFLLEKRPYFNNFKTPEEDRDSSKGIILTDEEFCKMFINKPVRDDLNYPGLIEKFKSSGFKCTSSGPSGPSAAGTSAPPQQSPVDQLVQMGFKEADAIRALNDANGNAVQAVAILLSAAADSGVSVAGTSAAPGARGGVVSSAQVATIDDFLNAQAGITINLPKRIQQFLTNPCPKFTDALFQINTGRKSSHWIWYILPSSPGQSDISKFFGIGPRANRANVTPEQYLDDPTLSAQYVAMLNAIGIQLINYMKENAGRPFDVTKFLIHLMGEKVDYEKLKDSLTIFYPILFERGLVSGEIALLYRNIFPKTLLGPPTGLMLSGPSAVPPRGPPPHGPSAAFGPPLPSEQSEQTIQRLMNGIFTRADVILALNKTNNNIEAAVDVLNTAASQSPFATPPCNEYINFEHRISDTMEQPDKILKRTYNISVDDNTSLGIALKWADASYQCNLFYDASFKEYVTVLLKQNYEYLVMKSLEMTVNPKQLPFKTQEINDDGWCFYRAVLTAAQRNPGDVRKFAQAITYCVTHIFTNTEDVMKQPLNIRVNGIPSQITAEQLVKLISIPNLTEKKHPCVYPELDQCIGQAAAYILQKNIFIYDEHGSLIGKYCGTDSTDPNNQIYLVNTNRNHFDIITSFNS